MKKCESFDDLQELGTEKIHERTHIARDKVELLLTKSYAQIGKVQFMGFVSILEREYGVDLGTIRDEYTQFWNQHEVTLPPKSSVILQPSSNAKQKWILAGIAAIVLLTAGAYVFQTVLSNDPGESVIRLDVPAIPSETEEANLSAIEDANLSDAGAEVNATAAKIETNTTLSAPRETVTVEHETVASVAQGGSLTITPAYKVWVGMIDTATGEKKQMITSEPFSLDTSKNWMVVLGHGRVEIATPSGKQVLKEKDTVWMAYEGGSLKRLTKEEFLQLNGGKNW